MDRFIVSWIIGFIVITLLCAGIKAVWGVLASPLVLVVLIISGIIALFGTK